MIDFNEAQKYIPSGVNSPVRAFGAVGGSPVFMKRAKGSKIFDEAGKEYLDFCGSWGPMIFGHAPDNLIASLKDALENGTSFGTATVKEVEAAKKINSFFPSMQKIRLVSSGTEAVMSSIRLARGFTGRKKILKLDGGYHGHVDSLLIQAGSGAATFGVPDSAGVPEELAKLTLTIPFNDFEALEEIFKTQGEEMAAFILEPVPANMGVVIPQVGYLERARELTQKYGALLIFDEVITGFRVSAGGAQNFFGVTPDLTTLGKIVGGGFPLAAFGGRADIMDYLAPAGPVYQAGTLSGNPIAVTACLWMLEHLNEDTISELNKMTLHFLDQLEGVLSENKLPLQLNRIASMFTLFFTAENVTDYASAKKSDTAKYAGYFKACLSQGFYLAPSQFEANFVSVAHTQEDLNRALEGFKEALLHLMPAKI